MLRGDNVTDENQFYAVFSLQGTGAGHMAAGKLVDAISRLPGNDGADCDAIGAQHQVKFSSMGAQVEPRLQAWAERIHRDLGQVADSSHAKGMGEHR